MKLAIFGLALVACRGPAATPAPGPSAVMTESPVRGWVVLARGPAEPEVVSRAFEVTEQTPVAKLLVKAIEGAPEIEQIQLEYVDDSQPHVIRLERRLVEGDGQVIELSAKRQISKLVVITDPDSTGEYIVFGA